MNNPLTTEQHNSVWSPLYQQRAFRALMSAFSFPGRRQSLPLCSDATGPTCIAAVLCDNEVSLADPDQLIDSADVRRLGIREAGVTNAGFIVADGSQAPTFEPALGNLAEPEQGATIIIRVASLEDSNDFPLILQGPGIEDKQALSVNGLNREWLAERTRWNRNFPMGVDLILMDDTQVVALPRTTRISGGTN
ncbi:phosphonate C-P lyase system protein PhnH [Marinobacter persicus]|jgi:alpha-D-ribose 1-methylphosphonate 5-triphosphate synthase subunit PhnH|uniref:Alpha-D-ribose 1-methylphosphonate 5-triphosphate synthase subunit PhnH n=1 Tax=Marinobacter persicus TaxID=930118 RepID=A0A2S6G5E5_9GAMM|nr:phosphonate C-P lyase system protein PhnH [Marinobacter persicus]PPK51096.1 alpha-D-ribose 1-methylphosphonate 5-triphosphate synthase subunit PhnH [Marinobacter persicus]PPK54354.1 alpha-D-ribose 1-methylphosphonate 5-triphosphate synthase subunit PhnH [Marinobacter persicus]PPK57698.1 alpha-D-ribose 1-methylphosphonate 5-triphosphate synthase subunit PhnH [Marinobacter persicus]